MILDKLFQMCAGVAYYPGWLLLTQSLLKWSGRLLPARSLLLAIWLAWRAADLCPGAAGNL